MPKKYDGVVPQAGEDGLSWDEAMRGAQADDVSPEVFVRTPEGFPPVAVRLSDAATSATAAGVTIDPPEALSSPVTADQATPGFISLAPGRPNLPLADFAEAPFCASVPDADLDVGRVWFVSDGTRFADLPVRELEVVRAIMRCELKVLVVGDHLQAVKEVSVALLRLKNSDVQGGWIGNA